MRIILSAFYIITVMTFCGYAAICKADDFAAKRDDTSFAYLSDWAGKSPTEISAKNEDNLAPHGNLWDDPKVMTALTRALGKERTHKIITGWDGEYALANTVERVSLAGAGDFIAFYACKPHDCAAYSASVFISLNSGNVQSCWSEDSEVPPGSKNFTTKESWLNISGETVLSEGDCQVHSLQKLLDSHSKLVNRDLKVN